MPAVEEEAAAIIDASEGRGGRRGGLRLRREARGGAALPGGGARSMGLGGLGRAPRAGGIHGEVGHVGDDVARQEWSAAGADMSGR